METGYSCRWSEVNIFQTISPAMTHPPTNADGYIEFDRLSCAE